MATKTVLETLEAARKRIKSGWNKGCYAKNAEGIQVSLRSDKAVCWCAEGSMILEQVPAEGWVVFKNAAGCGHIPSFNDDPMTTQADVLRAFDAAIEKVRANV